MKLTFRYEQDTWVSSLIVTKGGRSKPRLAKHTALWSDCGDYWGCGFTFSRSVLANPEIRRTSFTSTTRSLCSIYWQRTAPIMNNHHGLTRLLRLYAMIGFKETLTSHNYAGQIASHSALVFCLYAVCVISAGRQSLI